MPDGQSRTLKTPTYLGLVFSQFLAAFNDQAVHIIAVFYGGDMLVRYARVAGIDEKTIVFVVPACFVAPFFLFSPLAGVLADKYSKRSIIVFWKMAEVAIMALAFVGFLMPQLAAWGWADSRTMAIASAWVIIAAVFLMGTHSAFFVPAKYGIMPEILHPAILSKGNGFLEGTSFLAQILGTSFGGLLYGPLKPTFQGERLEAGGAWIIGVVLFALALVGAMASLLMAKIPPAAGDRVFTLNPLAPLANNLSVVRKSRPLILAVLGIAFFTFMTLFLRQGLLYEGETSKDLNAAKQAIAVEKSKAESSPADAPPGSEQAEALVPGASEAQQAELRVALLVAFIGLGVGIGSWLAGYLSGTKVELGLVPIGAVFIAIATAGLAAVTKVAGSTSSTVFCLILIGCAAGLYIVPLYTLLQHRAPKQSKGSLVATSNFLNSTAGLLAVAAFLGITTVFEGVLGIAKHDLELITDPAERVAMLEEQIQIPRLLFLSAALFTVGMLFVLRRQLPDFFLRSAAWLRSFGRVKLDPHNVQNLPGSGPVVLLTNTARFSDALHVTSLTDRRMQFIIVESPGDVAEPAEKLTRLLARRAGYVVIAPGETAAAAWANLDHAAAAALRGGDILAIAVQGEQFAAQVDHVIDEARRAVPAPIVTIHHETQSSAAGEAERSGRNVRRVKLTVGEPLGGDVSAADARRRLSAAP